MVVGSSGSTSTYTDSIYTPSERGRGENNGNQRTGLERKPIYAPNRREIRYNYRSRQRV
jgi:hypothetical protein